jgi:hypothetical protein
MYKGTRSSESAWLPHSSATMLELSSLALALVSSLPRDAAAATHVRSPSLSSCPSTTGPASCWLPAGAGPCGPWPPPGFEGPAAREGCEAVSCALRSVLHGRLQCSSCFRWPVRRISSPSLASVVAICGWMMSGVATAGSCDVRNPKQHMRRWVVAYRQRTNHSAHQKARQLITSQLADD